MPTIVPVKLKFSASNEWYDPNGLELHKFDFVIVDTDRGREFGTVAHETFEVPDEEIEEELRPIIRIATQQDVKRAANQAERGDSVLGAYRDLVKKHELDMKPVGVDFIFGGDKAVCYFAAEERVDFRELVKDLAREFKIRIDMRQIGVRDEAAISSGIAPCGQELCCARLGGNFESISIKMAKTQDLSLNPTTISGMCGRLMCCLRYEVDAYKDFKQRAPKYGAAIETPFGEAEVSGFDTPKEHVIIYVDDEGTFEIPLALMSYKDKKKEKAKYVPYEKAVLEDKRPNAVTREALEQLKDTKVKVALSKLDAADMAEELREQEETKTDSPQTRPKKRSRSKENQKRRQSRKIAQDSNVEKLRSKVEQKKSVKKAVKKSQMLSDDTSRRRRRRVSEVDKTQDKSNSKNTSTRRRRRRRKID